MKLRVTIACASSRSSSRFSAAGTVCPDTDPGPRRGPCFGANVLHLQRDGRGGTHSRCRHGIHYEAQRALLGFSADSLSRRQRVQCIRKRMTQPIRLILPDLFQDRLAKLTEHAAHVDVVIGAVAQHGLRVAPVTQWLQRQAMRVLKSLTDSPSGQGG